MSDSFKERRKHPRIYRNFILTCHEKGNAALVYEVSQINNISKGGLSFSSTRCLQAQAAMIFELKTPFISDAITLEGFVLECKEKIPNLIYEIRIQFKDLAVPAENILDKIESYENSIEN